MARDIVEMRWYVVGAPWLSSDQIPYIVMAQKRGSDVIVKFL